MFVLKYPMKNFECNKRNTYIEEDLEEADCNTDEDVSIHD